MQRIKAGALSRIAGFGMLFLAAHAGAETLELKDGTLVRGEVVERNDTALVVQSPSLGKITVQRRDLAGAGPAASRPRQGSDSKPKEIASEAGEAGPPRDPADQALFFMPTAFTPPARAFSFRDFELFFLTLGFSPIDATAITVGFLFPITPELQVLTAGFKQRLWQDPDGLKAVSLTGNVTKPVGELNSASLLLANSNLVAGWRNQAGAGAHAAVGYLAARSEEDDDYYNSESIYVERKTHEWKGSLSYALGAECRVTPHAKFLGEYLSAMPFDADGDFNAGLLTVGFRLHGDHLSADIAGTRPIVSADLGSFFMWPLLVVSYRY
jgi:hypothetical protein